ncbi:MAG: hypothetical protein PHU27_03525 [Salinivirgaceae bacterium]|nr:hypothetical protein [Salinivirgaceae bacterium]MDD4747460.1 hypothetical protein [Salinivirgaceae bacterium]
MFLILHPNLMTPKIGRSLANMVNTRKILHRTLSLVLLVGIATIWVSHYKGLYKFNPSEAKYIKIESNPKDQFALPSDIVYSIATDAKGNVWLTTPKGITIYNPQKDLFITGEEPIAIIVLKFNICII